jgi:hypothetical protein
VARRLCLIACLLAAPAFGQPLVIAGPPETTSVTLYRDPDRNRGGAPRPPQ